MPKMAYQRLVDAIEEGGSVLINIPLKNGLGVEKRQIFKVEDLPPVHVWLEPGPEKVAATQELQDQIDSLKEQQAKLQALLNPSPVPDTLRKDKVKA